MTIVARFFPNGEFSHGVDTSKKRSDKQRRDTQPTQRLDKERRDEYLQWLTWFRETYPRGIVHTTGSRYLSESGITYTLREVHENSCSLEWCDARNKIYTTHLSKNFDYVFYEWRLTPLVYQSVESCEKPKSRKKLTSMSKSMARNIRNGVYVLEQMPGGKDVLSFLTLTLPSLSPEGLRACCENWDYMVKRFFDWLRTALKASNIELQHVYCTEIQSKRLQSRGEYAPHLHVVFRGRNDKRKPWAISPKKARKAWSDCIRSVTHEQFDSSALENLQRIKYSAARYLSKYLSKGCNIIPDGTETTPIQSLKTQWGGMARTISKRIRETTQRFGGTGKASRLILCMLRNMETLLRYRYVRYYKKGFIPLGYDPTEGLEYGLHVGCGCLRTPTYEGGLIPVLQACYTEFIDYL